MVISGEELAVTAFLYTTASPGTTGPILIFTSRVETATGEPVEALDGLGVPVFGLVAFVCPATGRLALPGGATATPAEPVKK